MGVGNVTSIQTTWGHLSDQQHRLAVFMGRVAKDAECEFYGGRELLAIGLGKACPPAPADDDDSTAARDARRVRRTTFEAVRRCLRELEEAGFIVQTRAPARGQTTKYKLIPIYNGPERVWPVTDQSESGPLPESTGQTHSVQRARLTVPTGQTQPANGPEPPWPKEEEDLSQDSREDPSGPVGEQPQVRAAPADDDDDDPEAERMRARRRSYESARDAARTARTRTETATP